MVWTIRRSAGSTSPREILPIAVRPLAGVSRQHLPRGARYVIRSDPWSPADRGRPSLVLLLRSSLVIALALVVESRPSAGTNRSRFMKEVNHET